MAESEFIAGVAEQAAQLAGVPPDVIKQGIAEGASIFSSGGGRSEVMKGIINSQTAKNILEGAAGALGDTVSSIAKKAGAKFNATDATGQEQNKASEIVSTDFDLPQLKESLMNTIESKSGDSTTTGSIQPADTVASHLSAETATNVLGTAGAVLGEASGIPGAAEAGRFVGGGLGGALAEFAGALEQKGVPDEEVKEAILLIDENGDAAISAVELRDAGNDPFTLAELNTINPSIGKLITDSSFVSRVIQRKKIPSIYGHDFFQQFNQVELTEQAIGLDHESANQFNVGFSGGVIK